MSLQYETQYHKYFNTIFPNLKTVDKNDNGEPINQLLSYSYANEKNFPKIIELKKDNTTDELYGKAFLVDASVNKNGWNIPDNDMKKYATGFISKPLIVHPTYKHPDYLREGVVSNSPTFLQDVLSHQEKYKVGEIMDVRYEPVNPDIEDNGKKAWFAYFRFTNPQFASRLKSGAEPFFVSPQVYDLHEMPVPGITSEFMPVHLAVVKEPAYGSVATIRGVCDGNGVKCVDALRSAAEDLLTKINTHADEFHNTNGDSSYLKNSTENNYRSNLNPLLNNNQNNQNYDPNAQFNQNANVGYNPNTGQTQTGAQQQRVTTESVTPDGKKIKNIIESPNTNDNTNTSSSPSNLQPNSEVNNNTNTNPNPQYGQTPPQSSSPQEGQSNPQATAEERANTELKLPREIMEALDKIKLVTDQNQELSNKVNELQNFKNNMDSERVKKAAEEQRTLVEEYFTEGVIADPAAREEIVNFFTTLNITDDQLRTLLDMVVSGGFVSASTDKEGKKVSKTHRLKSAAMISESLFNAPEAVLQSIESNENYYRRKGIRPSSQFAESFMGDNINWNNLK